MADVNGVQATKAFTGSPEDKARTEFFGGHLRVMSDTYEASALENPSVITVGILPSGALLEGGRIVHDALGTDVTLAVALRPVDGGADVELQAATAAADAGTIELDDIDKVIQFVVSTPHFVVIKTAGGAATGTIKSQLRYTAIA